MKKNEQFDLIGPQPEPAKPPAKKQPFYILGIPLHNNIRLSLTSHGRSMCRCGSNVLYVNRSNILFLKTWVFGLAVCPHCQLVAYSSVQHQNVLAVDRNIVAEIGREKKWSVDRIIASHVEIMTAKFFSDCHAHPARTKTSSNPRSKK